MKSIFKILFSCALLLAATAVARADDIVWKQPPAPPLHQNLHFEGNAVLDSTDVRQLQKALMKRNFYKGNIDGLWGPQTSQAVLDYQAVHQQPLTGTVTAGTLQDLGIHPVKKKKPVTAQQPTQLAPKPVARPAPAEQVPQ